MNDKEKRRALKKLKELDKRLEKLEKKVYYSEIEEEKDE